VLFRSSIYQWRGSDLRNILTFATRRAPVTTVQLTTNRRSRPSIVETANSFATTIPERLAKRMEATRPAGIAERTAFSADTDEDEAARISHTVTALHEKGFRYADIAVLFRSVRTAAPPLLAAFEARQIPFSCAGRTGLFLQPEIALFGELHAWFVDGDWKDDRYGESRKADLDQIVRGLSRHFGDEDELPGLRKYLTDWRGFHLRGTRPVSLVDDFYKLLVRLGAHRIDVNTPQGSARFGAFARFSEILADFEHVNRRGGFTLEEGRRVFRAGRDRGKPYFQALYNYLLHWARDAYEDFAGEAHADLDAVDVLTVHQAKGLEWPVVFLPSLVKGRFPSQRAGREQDWLLPESIFPRITRARYEGGDAEERRLFYVALTRARDALYLSCFRRKTRSFEPSPYLVEIAGENIPDQATLPLPAPPTAATPTEPPALEVSFSDLARIDECAHAYRLGTVFGFQQALAPELGYGKAIHHVLRQLAEQVRAGAPVPDDDGMERLVDHEFYVPFATPASYANMRTAALRLVRRYLDDYAADLQRIWAVEHPFALHFDEGIVSGRADVIFDEEGGQQGNLAIVDYKVSSDPEREERYHLQLAVYAAAGRGEGLTVKAAWLHELRDGARTPVDVSAEATVAASAKVRDLLKLTRAGELLPRPEIARCTRCDFHRVCAHSACGNG
jgi:DNA helicase-2/ATP-dependent DNA helicase PcrA